MSKLGLASLFAATALGLAACSGAEENNMAIENVEDIGTSEDLNMGMDMNTDMNMDMNATDNAMDNSMDNSATTNSY